MDYKIKELFDDYKDVIRDHGKELIDLITVGELEPVNDQIRRLLPTNVLTRRLHARAERHKELQGRKDAQVIESRAFLNEFLTAMLYKVL